MTVNPDWLIPQWPAPAQVHALCTTRAGGQSVAPYDGLNLGDHVGDRPTDVAANRTALQEAIGAKPVFLSQIHGTQVQWLTDRTAHGAPSDACVTDQSGIACTIMVADCLPVLLTNEQGSRVAAAHAGWRGLGGEAGRGVLEALLSCLAPLAEGGTQWDASKTMAWLGPCIGADAFEVGDEVRELFVAQQPQAHAMFKPKASNKWLADLQGLARLRLAALGVTQIYGNDGTRAWCTVSQPLRFFSHRRDRVSGRMAACIWLD